MPILDSHLQDGVRTLTLNRPERRNALSDDLLAALRDAIADCGADGATRVVIIAANGPAFCAGHDLREVQQKSTLDEMRDLFHRCSQVMTAIVTLPKPVIARVDGIATAAGCQLAASCDLVTASPRATFATPGVHIGLFCSTPMVALSRKVGRATAMQMLLTGDPLSAQDAQTAGLVNQVVPSESLPQSCRALAQKIAAKSPLTLAIGKEAFYRQLEMPLEDAYTYCSEVMAQNMMKRDAREGIAAFTEKRPPVWTGK